MKNRIVRRALALCGLITVTITAVVVLAPHPAGISASFPAGTPIMTPDGPVPIERLRAGEDVISYDPSTGEAVVASIIELATRSHTGEIVQITAGFIVSATERHAFWVVSGERLSIRPAAPGDRTGLTPDGRWVSAQNIREGDTLLAIDGERRVSGVGTLEYSGYVYDVRLTGIGAVAVGDGVYAGDATRDEGPRIAESTGGEGGGGGGCFVAGTVVLTSTGAKAIQTIGSGDQVWSWNPVGRSWELSQVEDLLVHDYTGDTVEVSTDAGVITATGNHPFWVESGVRLAERPLAEDLGSGSLVSGSSGRWVAARELVAGDQLVSRSGSTTVRSVRTLASNAEVTVYNLSVGGDHTYAVGTAGVAVHNKGSAESAPSESMAPDGTRGSDRRDESDGPDWVTDDESAAATTPSTAERDGAAARARVTESGLSAGYSDDNLEFGAFLRFLDEYAAAAPHYELAVNERIVLTVTDANGKTVPNATVTVSSGSQMLAEGTTYSDGRFLFFPSEYGTERSYSVQVAYSGRTQSFELDRTGVREVEIVLGRPRQAMQQVPLDVLFVLDTTGSMGEEIDRLTQSIEIIHLNLTSLSTNPLVRFGMVLYKDRGDEYTTRTVALTPDINQFQSELSTVYASGGGDYPEDLQEALGAATRQIEWDPNGVRLVFIITDAPPQLYRDQEYTYADAAHDARRDGIKFYTVGTGGMDIQGEYPLRQLSQYTGARYIFLTYGESGESAGGVPGSVSHHTGANYETDKLEAIIIRFAKEELQYLTDTPVESDEPYFTAVPINSEERDATLRSLFSSAISQLLAYSSWEIPPGAPTAVVPFHVSSDALGVQAEYLSEQLLLTMRQDESAREAFTLVERQNMQAILEEIEFQLSGLADSGSVTRVGEFLGAQLLMSGTLYEGADEYELFIRLLRVETGEVLAVTKAIIDRGLVP